MVTTNSELLAALRDADEEELLELVGEREGELEPAEALQTLRNPYASARVVELLARNRRLLRLPEMVREIVAHPRAPESLALNLVPRLFWRDLVKLGSNVRTRPRIRRAADVRLAGKLGSLSVGERIAIARMAGPGAMARLRNDPSPRVVGALLENPRMTEGVLMPLICNERTRPEVLETVAKDRKWGFRYNVRVTLARNPQTPVQTALGLLPALKKRDLDAVASDVRIAAAVRRRADLLLGRGP